MKKLLLIFTLSIFLLPFSFSQEYGWVKINTDIIPGTIDFTDVFFSPPSTVWITTNTTNNIFKTNDGGTSFSTQTTDYGTQAVYAFDTIYAYSGGLNGRVYYTSDGGLNWPAIGSISVTLNDLDFASSTQGYACGSSGAVFSIANGSVSNLNSPSSSTLRGISAPSVNNVWICGGNRIYYYNGSTFTSQIAPPGTFNDIHFIDNQKGWVVGDSGIIGYTEDGGANWNKQTNPDPQKKTLFGVFFFDSDYGWAVGADGVILYTSNGGSTWAVVGAGLTTENLTSIHFTSATNGYVAGGGKTLLKYTGVAVDENTDATLGSIQINSEELAGFNAQTLGYNLELPAGTNEIPNITVTATINEATVEITQATALPGTATIVVTAKDGVTQQTYTIHFTVVTGIFDPEKNNEIKIYPNPVSEKLIIALPETTGFYKLKIVNSIGQVVLLKKSFSGNEIDVSGLTTGVYFLMLQNRKEIYTERFVKN